MTQDTYGLDSHGFDMTKDTYGLDSHRLDMTQDTYGQPWIGYGIGWLWIAMDWMVWDIGQVIVRYEH